MEHVNVTPSAEGLPPGLGRAGCPLPWDLTLPRERESDDEPLTSVELRVLRTDASSFCKP